MRNINPNYSEYSLKELYEAVDAVDREKYPERYNEIKKCINELNELRKPEYQCMKCGAKDYEVGEFHAAGSTLAKILDVDTGKFTTVSCRRCTFTEIYRCGKDDLANFIDFFIT